MREVKESDFLLLVCEDVRKEDAGQVSLIGVSLNNRINMIPPAGQKNAIGSIVRRLSLFFSLVAGEGEYELSYEVRSPSSKILASDRPQTVRKEWNITLSTVIELSPMRLEEFGEYVVCFTINGVEFQKKFWLLDEGVP